MTTMSELWQAIERLDEFEREEVAGIIQRRERTRVLVNDLTAIALQSLDGKVTAPMQYSSHMRGAIVDLKNELNLLTQLDGEILRDACENVARMRRKLAERIQKARRRSASIQSKTNAAARRLEEIRKLADQDLRMPTVPKAVGRASEIAALDNRFSGVYFCFNHVHDVVYVGESQDVPRRLKHHHAISPNEWVSYLEFPPEQRFFAECYYIWLLRPNRNREGRKTIAARNLESHHTEG